LLFFDPLQHNAAMPRDAYDMVSVYLFRQDGEDAQFLMLRRAPDIPFGGTWQPVYGGIKPDETAWQAAIREMREETGLLPVELYQANTVNSFYVAADDTVYHCPCFAARVEADGAVELNDEHDAFEWLNPDAMRQRLMWAGQKRIFEEIVQEIVNPGPAIAYLRIPI
jgi:dATP pyrophosphohydrolase